MEQNVLGTALMRQEEQEKGGVAYIVHGTFIKASGFMRDLPIVIATLILAQSANTLTNI